MTKNGQQGPQGGRPRRRLRGGEQQEGQLHQQRPQGQFKSSLHIAGLSLTHTLCLILILTFLNGQVVETNSFGFDNDDEVIVVDPFAPDSDLDENGYDSRRPRVCPPGQKLVEKPEGLVCKTDYSLQYVNPRNLPNINDNVLIDDHEVILPNENDPLSTAQETCLANRKIHWPFDGNCYPLLHRGPCGIGEWLVASKVNQYYYQTKIKVSCQIRVCPCRAEEPDLCEVQPKDQSRNQNCRNCVVALAAEQDGICESGEQLLTTPFGFGVCGCRLKPYLHVPWSFGSNQQRQQRCYPLHQQGPCQQNETLHWNPRRNEPLCVPTVCPLGYVLSVEDGNCHVLNTQGPCSNPEDIFTIDEWTMQPKCIPHQYGKIKRIFDVLPSSNGGQTPMLRQGSSGGLSSLADPRMGKRNNMAHRILGAQYSNRKNEKAVEFLKWIRGFL